MDNPSWNDTLRASLAACVPCLVHPPPNADSDTEDPPDLGDYAIRRARADELEGLLADAERDGGDAAADADAISLHSHLGPRGRRRPPPRTPRHIALWGFSLFGSGRVKLPVEGAPEPLHRPASHPPPYAAAGPRRREGSGSDGAESTRALLSAAALDAEPTQLSEADIERRARRRARKEMRRLAAAVAAQPGAEFEGFPGSGSPVTPSAHRGIPTPFLDMPADELRGQPQPQPQPEARAAMLDDDDEAAADLDGLSYARLAPRTSGGSGSRSSGRSSNSGSGGYSAIGAGYERVGAVINPAGYAVYEGKTKKRSKSGRRSTKSKSSATSSTLASPRAEEFGAFASAPPLSPSYSPAAGYASKAPAAFEGAAFGGAAVEEGGEDDFDGTPGFSAREGAPSFAAGAFDGVPGGLDFEGMPREALPSPGLSRGFSRGTRGKEGGAFLANA